MEKIFKKKLTKKGFTLAELLIVVAIIAILVAVAAPIFINSLDGARKAVFDANKRSIKAIAVSEILSKWSSYGKNATDSNYAWKVTGEFDEAGNITVTKIEKWDTGEESDYDKKTSYSYSDGTYSNIVVKITQAEVTATPGA